MNEVAFNHHESVKIAQGIYWVGNADAVTELHCNPYLIVDGDEAVLLDGGSRGDFSTVMLKIMRTGTNPQSISRLIYHHYDPDACGSVPHLEELISNPELKIISQRDNNPYIQCYTAKSPLQCIEQLNCRFTFQSGRELRFIPTPYSHCPGSFMTLDTLTGVLFSSDLFGSYSRDWSLFTTLDERCGHCDCPAVCPATDKPCPLRGILTFHRQVMPSRRALDYALTQVEQANASLIAPQHGSVLHTRAAVQAVIRQLRALDTIGLDHFLAEHKA